MTTKAQRWAARLAVEGLCARGRSHGPAVSGRRQCEACAAQDRARRGSVRVYSCRACGVQGHTSRSCPSRLAP
jgi:ribosomal protein L37AE/L43A